MNKKNQSTNDTKSTKEKIFFKEECYAIQGAIFDVYREMGCGFLEAVYQECLEKELTSRGIPFSSQKELKLIYKGQTLRQFYKPDFICYKSIIVELKALSSTTSVHKAQILNYLKASGIKLGLLVNFGAHPKAIVERVVL